MDLKRCFKCERDLPIAAFYRHRQMADGHLSKCGDCTRADVKKHRLDNLERVRAYDNSRANEPQRKELRGRVTRKWREANPDGAKAQQIANNAVRDKKITKVNECEGCGRTGVRIEKHHPDYSEPLFVMWLCKPCHVIADKIRRKTEREVA
jgi:hypothetical protein